MPDELYFFGYFPNFPSPHFLQLFSRMPQHCFAWSSRNILWNKKPSFRMWVRRWWLNLHFLINCSFKRFMLRGIEIRTKVVDWLTFAWLMVKLEKYLNFNLFKSLRTYIPEAGDNTWLSVQNMAYRGRKRGRTERKGGCQWRKLLEE